MKILWEGQVAEYDVASWFKGYADHGIDVASMDPADRLDVLNEGTFLLQDGTPATGAELTRMRNRFDGTYNSVPDPAHPGWKRNEGERRWLIPGLWAFGHIPMLGGNPKAGKSVFIVYLIAALMIAGRRFLDYFEPADLTIEERARGLWLIAGEGSYEDYEPWFREAGLIDATFADEDGYAHRPADWVSVDYLEENQGDARSFDLRDPHVYDAWLDRLMYCTDPDGVEGCYSPLVVIVDGVTAILNNSTDGYGEWYAAFRRLMKQLDVPNALVVVHNTLEGSHPMGGVAARSGPDGVWTYSMKDADNPLSQRYFSAGRRMLRGAVGKILVDLDDDSLRARASKDRTSSRAKAERTTELPTSSSRSTEDVETMVMDYVNQRAANGYAPGATAIRGNVRASNPETDAAVDRLVKNGRLVRDKRAGRGGGFAYRPVGQDPPAAGGNAAK